MFFFQGFNKVLEKKKKNLFKKKKWKTSGIFGGKSGIETQNPEIPRKKK